jgi:hypothetical protein
MVFRRPLSLLSGNNGARATLPFVPVDIRDVGRQGPHLGDSVTGGSLGRWVLARALAWICSGRRSDTVDTYNP